MTHNQYKQKGLKFERTENDSANNKSYLRDLSNC